MRRVAILQARMTSERLPGKVLAEVAGRPMIEHQLRRLERCERVDELVVATTTNADDDPLAELCARLGVRAFRGSEHDVLSRYTGAAREADADLVVRLTSDCPLAVASEVDVVVRELEERRTSCDYASNGLEPTLPRGLDAEALWRDVLERADRMATSKPAREHVTWFVYSERPDLFTLHAVRRHYDAADLRWTVDTDADLAMVRRLYDELGLAERDVPLDELIAYVRANPDIAAMNAHVEQKKAAG